MQNKIRGSLSYFRDNLEPKGTFIQGAFEADYQSSLKKLDNILENYNLKRACCLQSTDPTNPDYYLVKVRRPLTRATLSKLRKGDPLTNMYKKYGFVDVPIRVPKSACKNLPSYKPGSLNCDNFYTTYCYNVIYPYEKGLGNVNYGEFALYKPECACYLKKPSWFGNTNVPPICYTPGCVAQSGVYLDPDSKMRPECNQTICNAITSIREVGAGRDAAITNRVQQNCGSSGILPNIPGVSTITSTIAKTPMGKTIDRFVPGGTQILISGVSMFICCMLVILLLMIMSTNKTE